MFDVVWCDATSHESVCFIVCKSATVLPCLQAFRIFCCHLPPQAAQVHRLSHCRCRAPRTHSLLPSHSTRPSLRHSPGLPSPSVSRLTTLRHAPTSPPPPPTAAAAAAATSPSSVHATPQLQHSSRGHSRLSPLARVTRPRSAPQRRVRKRAGHPRTLPPSHPPGTGPAIC